MALVSIITPDAAAQLFIASQWYDEREPNSTLGLELVAEFDEVLDFVCESPEMFPVYDGTVRRALLNRFPYAIYYEREPDRIVVLTFLAMSQERGPVRRR
jgi:hypothetical protein